MELIETSTFTRQVTALLSDEEYGGFQSRIAANPEIGALIRGGGGIERFALASDREERAAALGSSTIGRCEKT